MSFRPIRIAAAAVGKPGADGEVTDSLLIKARRSRKVGALPHKARMVLAAAEECLRAAGAAGDRDGVSLGTLYGSMDVAEQCLQAMHTGGFGQVTPSWYATGLPNATAAIVASTHELRGPNLTVLGYQAGVEAILFGCRQILAGRARAMLAGGFDVASERCIAQLRAAPAYAGASGIHAGVGLVWLTENGEPAPGATTVVGWSQGIIDEDAFRAAEFSGLIELAARAGGPLRAPPALHVVHPGREGVVDYLAATAPIHLIEHVVTAGVPGVHALIVRGFGPSIVCLLVEKRT